jgi:hypothetical protein
MAEPPSEPVSVALYRYTLEHRQKIAGLIMTSGVALAIPAAVTCYTAYLENSTKQIELQIQQEEKSAAAAAKLREQQLSELQFRQKAISDFATYGLNQDIELRIRLAEYFAELSDSTVQQNWRSYLKTLSDKRAKAVAELERANAAIDALSSSTTPDLLALKAELRKKALLEAAFNPVQSGIPVTVVDSPNPPPTNDGLTTVPDKKLLEWFGEPMAPNPLATNCGDLQNTLLQEQMKTISENGRQVTLLTPALDSFDRVMRAVILTSPGSVQRIRSITSLCVKPRRNAISFSKTSYGMAVNIIFDSVKPGQTETSDYFAFARAFKQEGWIWGGAWNGPQQEFPRFEVSLEKLEEWRAAGQLKTK